MKHYSLLRLKQFPEIDELNCAKVTQNFVYDDNFFLNCDQVLVQNVQPLMDIKPNSNKIPIFSAQNLQNYYVSFKSDFLKSFSIHIGLVFIFYIFNIISFFQNKPPEIVEVTFGLTDELNQIQQKEITKQIDGETEATKTKEDLPQLVKNAAPDIGPKPSVEHDQDTSKLNSQMILHDKNIPKPLETHKNETQDHKIVGKKMPTEQQKLDEKDYLIRKEEDLRKEAELKKQGVHQKNSLKKDGQKHNSTSLPKSPFQTSESLPSAPPGLAPAGEENGVNVSNYNQYRAYLKNQLRMNWNISEGSAFPKKLKCVVEFTVNSFGYLTSTPSISKSSGDKNFDALALKSLQSTFPVSTPPPKNIKPPQTFKATYSSVSVN